MNIFITVLCFAVAVQCFTPLISEDSLYSKASPELQRQLSRQHNQQLLMCSMEDLAMFAEIEDVEKIIHAVAKANGITTTALISRILRKLRAKQKLEKIKYRNSLQDLALKELYSSVAEIPKGSFKRPPLSVAKSPQITELPADTISKLHPSREDLPRVPLPPNQPNQRPPEFLRSPSIIPLRPPPGVTVTINPGGAESAVPDVTVAASPMMSVIEALQQADLKFQEALRLSHESEMLSFSRVPFAECYVVSRFDKVISTGHLAWKVSISDRDGRVIYDNLCLPLGKDIIVTPGMTISLRYTAF